MRPTNQDPTTDHDRPRLTMTDPFELTDRLNDSRLTESCLATDRTILTNRLPPTHQRTPLTDSFLPSTTLDRLPSTDYHRPNDSERSKSTEGFVAVHLRGYDKLGGELLSVCVFVSVPFVQALVHCVTVGYGLVSTRLVLS